MKPELDRKLVKTFPIIYRDRYGDLRNTAMVWGFDCGDGWFQIIWDLSEKLEAIARQQPEPKKHHPVKKFFWKYTDNFAQILRKKNWLQKDGFLYDLFWGVIYGTFMPPEDDRLKATQVKEKYGELRFYTNYSSDEIDEAIDKAELKSSVTCEVCGEPGKTRNGGWIVTLCDKHNEERINDVT